MESLYYCFDAMKAVAYRQADSLGRFDPEERLEAARSKALEVIEKDACLPKTMAARRCEKSARISFMALLPDWKKIKEADDKLEINETIENPYSGELQRFKSLVKAEDLDGLIARYPFKKSRVFEKITTKLHCKDQADYKNMVLALVRKSEHLTIQLKKRIRPLPGLLDVGTENDV